MSGGANDVQADEGRAIKIPIDGTLDLHTFLPREVKELVIAYLEECRARGILQVRIIHGKGKGILRKTVHATLAQLPWVRAYHLATAERGSWGATLVTLQPADPRPGK